MTRGSGLQLGRLCEHSALLRRATGGGGGRNTRTSTRTRINGVLDLRTSTLRAQDDEDMIFCLVPQPHNPYAQAPLWERLIYRWTQCDGSGQTAEDDPESARDAGRQQHRTETLS